MRAAMIVRVGRSSADHFRSVKRQAAPGRTRGEPSRGFTLLEMMTVLFLLLVLAALAVPGYEAVLRRGREAVLRDDLYTMRKMIDEYTLDKQKPPSSAEDLVEEHYLRGGLPVDPMTGSAETWQWDIEDVPISAQEAVPGIVDVHSGSDEISSDGTTPYSSW